MNYLRAIRLADNIFDELDRIGEQWLGVAGFKEVDSRDLLSFDLYYSIGVARDEFVYESEGGDAALVRN